MQIFHFIKIAAKLAITTPKMKHFQKAYSLNFSKNIPKKPNVKIITIQAYESIPNSFTATIKLVKLVCEFK